MTQTYFGSYLKQADSFIHQLATDLTLPAGDVHIDTVYYNLFSEYVKLICCTYSAGADVRDLTALLNSCLDALISYKDQPDATDIFFVGSVDEYMNALALLTWAITLPLDQARFDKLVNCIDGEGKRDALFDRLVAVRMPQRTISQTLYFPKLYSPLYGAVHQRSSEQMGRFLSQWYNTCLKRTANYELHTLHGGDDSGFTGYWAWEVAGLTYALNIDDAPYRDMAYYPKDLAQFARSS